MSIGGSMRTRNVIVDLPLGTPVDVEQTLLEFLRILGDAFARLDSSFGFLEFDEKVGALLL
jgi:hypothetical protein